MFQWYETGVSAVILVKRSVVFRSVMSFFKVRSEPQEGAPLFALKSQVLLASSSRRSAVPSTMEVEPMWSVF